MTKKRSRGADTSSTESSLSSGTKSVKTRRIQLNTVDPIMLTALGKENIWKFLRPNGSVVVFNLDSLVDYMLATGNFSDPETRIPFTDHDLQEIDALVVAGGLKKDSVLLAKQSPEKFSDMKFQRDALQAVERSASEVVTEILHIIEVCDPDEAQMRLMTSELPIFADYYQQLFDADREFARHCMSHWQQYLMGPPNKPNEDPYGLIEIVCGFFNSCGRYAHPPSSVSAQSSRHASATSSSADSSPAPTQTSSSAASISTSSSSSSSAAHVDAPVSSSSTATGSTDDSPTVPTTVASVLDALDEPSFISPRLSDFLASLDDEDGSEF